MFCEDFLGLTHCSCSSASTYAADKITIAYPVPSANVTIPLALKIGFLKEEGLEAQLVRVSGGAAMATLVNGEVDYYTVINPAVPAAIQGLPVKVVACFVIGSYHDARRSA